MSEPYYVQIQNYILEQIRTGQLKPDDKIPSESKLSEMFSVSRITSSQAVNQLAQQGYVYRRQGKGTFVLGNRREQQGLTIGSNMTYVFEDKDYDAVEGRHRTYDIRAIPASDEIAKSLALEPGEDVNQVIRIKYIADTPVCCEMIYIPVRYAGEIGKDGMGDEVTIADFLVREKGIDVRSNRIYLESIKAGIFESDRLNVDVGFPLLLLDHMLYDDAERPVTFTRLIVNNQSYRISIDFKTFHSLTVS